MNKDGLYPLIVLGGGGHASVLVEILQDQGREIIAVVSPDDITSRSIFSGLQWLCSDNEVLKNYSKDSVRLVNGIGMLPNSKHRKAVGEYYSSLGYKFERIISSSAIVSDYSVLEEGTQVLHFGLVNTGASIGRHSIVNDGAIVEHDSKIGAFNHICPKATVCGQVKTGDDTFVGAGATIIQGIVVPSGSVVGAGVTVSNRYAIDHNYGAFSKTNVTGTGND